VSILGVSGSLTPGITPSGNINITTMNQTDVTNYATAQVVDANIVAGNIKKNVSILGVIGSYEGSGGGGLQGYTLTINNDGSGHSEIIIYHPNGTSESVYIPGGAYNTIVKTDVAYIYWNDITQGTYLSGSKNILLLSDTTMMIAFPCFLKGSLVNLWNGKTKKIEDITYDDEILCWDFDNGTYAPAKPFWIKKAQTNAYYWVNRFESGKEIRTTGTVAGHRFFDVDEGKFLYNTECVGDICYTLDGDDRLVDAVKTEGECEFYNVYTHYHMNMFVNGILTGFRYNNLYPVKNMKFVKDVRALRPREEFSGLSDAWFYGMRCSEQVDSVEEIMKYAMVRELIRR
jgi:hypothetical protein